MNMKNIRIKSPETRLTPVCSINDAVQAEVIKNVLADHGITAEIFGEHQAGFTGTLNIQIVVREKDVKQAGEFLKTHFPEVM